MKTQEAGGTPRLDIHERNWRRCRSRAGGNRCGRRLSKERDPTLHYVTELLETKGTTLAALRELLCPCE